MTTARNAVIYARQSLLKEDKAESVARQIAACRELAARSGLTIVGDPFTDEGVSAYDGGRRVGFLALCDRIAAGGVDVILAMHPDRLYRQPADRIALLALAKAAGVDSIVTAQGGTEKLGEADSEFLGDLLAILGKRESATIGRRMRAKHAEKRAKGEWPGGPAPLGYVLVPEEHTLAIDPEAAPVAREAVARLLRGEPTLTVARWLSERLGRLVTPSTLGKLITSSTYAGLRNDGSRGSWPAIITPEDHAALVVLFAARKRGRRGPSRRHTFSGVLKCSECGTGMTAYRQRDALGWRCSAPNGGCGTVSIGDALVERVVVRELAAVLDSPEFLQALQEAAEETPAVAELSAELVAARGRLEALGDLLADGTMSPEEYRRLSGKLTTKVKEAEAALEAATRSAGTSSPALVLGLTGAGAFTTSWERWTPTERREVVAALAPSITVRPWVKGAGKVQEDRVKINQG